MIEQLDSLIAFYKQIKIAMSNLAIKEIAFPEDLTSSNNYMGHYLSDDQTEKYFIQYTSTKTSRPKFLTRKKGQRKQKMKRNRFDDMKIPYVSSQMLKLGSDGENDDGKSFLSQEPIEIGTKTTIGNDLETIDLLVKKDQTKIYEDTIRITQKPPKTSRCPTTLQDLRKIIKQTENKNNELQEQNKKLRKEIEKLKEYSQKQSKSLKEQSRCQLEQQRQINNCLEDTIEQLNQKIEGLLLQISDCSVLSCSRNTPQLQQGFSILSEELHEYHRGSKQDYDWLAQTNQILEQETNYLKKTVTELKKDISNLELKANMANKFRQELRLEKSLRQSYEKRNKFLANQLKVARQRKEKMGTSVRSNEDALEDSLSFSIDLE